MAENGGVPAAPSQDEISLNIPRKTGKDLYLMQVLRQIERFNMYVSSLDYSKPLRLRIITRSCIMMISDDTKRRSLLRAYTDAVDYTNCYSGLDNVDMIDRQLDIAVNAVGEVISWCDEFLGVSRQNVLVPLVAEPSENVKAAVADILEKYEKGEKTEGAPLE